MIVCVLEVSNYARPVVKTFDEKAEGLQWLSDVPCISEIHEVAKDFCSYIPPALVTSKTGKEAA